ncbi:MAG: mannose-1-phosphate guanylyltransferase/mannose-6-phosphate isomerase [Deltaproteobacteria bacterium]|nr:mannose-1-phosphate guanylyltransferase/mannose-6-phosphate isomerase [Deltaproteobacteria bacterium]
MYAVILAGGSGTRLWPVSRALFPKQFLSLPREGPTLFQATVERVLVAVAEERIMIVTHVDQAAEIRRQLALLGLQRARVLAEPEARNTAPAIGLAAWQIVREAGPDAVMAVLPSDHLIADSAGFAALLGRAETAAHSCGLVTFGIRPTGPETGYGYIRSGRLLDDELRTVEEFVEKPDIATARRYLADGGYFWNSGMFVFRVGALIEQYRLHLPDLHAALSRLDAADAAACRDTYRSLASISIDYGILEKASGVAVLPAEIGWSDLGSWEACYQAADQDERANSFSGRVCAVDTQGTLIRSDARLVAAVGLKDMIIIDTADALLVCERSRTQDVKKIVDQLTAEGAPEACEHRTVYRPWGSYTCLEMGEHFQVKRIDVNPGARLSLQSHRFRSENWVVAAGEALVTVDGRQIVVQAGEHVTIPLGARHRMENRGAEPLTVIEVQNGEYLGEDDIIRYEDDYGRSE